MNQIGLAYENMKEYDEAISFYCKSLGVNPNDSKIYFNRGVSYLYLDSFINAIYDFNKAITLDPKIGIYYHNKGLAHHLINEDIEACKCWKMADELGYSESSNYIKKYCSIDIIM